MNDHPYWFRRKTLGWGWEPGSRQGWIATGLFFIIDGAGSVLMAIREVHPAIIMSWAIGWIAVFLIVAATHAEPLR